jgi:hypothetical protein
VDQLLYPGILSLAQARPDEASRRLPVAAGRGRHRYEISTVLLITGTQFAVWSRKDGTSNLDLNDELDPDDLCPEGNVTKKFWNNLYQRIER